MGDLPMDREDQIEKDSKKVKLNRTNLRKLKKLFEFFRPYQVKFFIGLFLLICSSSILLAFPHVSGKLIDAATGKGYWFDLTINQIALFLIGVLVVQSILSFIRVYLFAVVSEKAMANMRAKLFEKFMVLPVHFYDHRRSGELISRITADVTQLQDVFSTSLAEFIRQTVILLFGTAFIFYTSPKLSTFMLGVFPILIIFSMIFGRFIRKLSKKTQDELAKSNVIVEEALSAIRIVKAYTNELYEAVRYTNSIQTMVKIALRTATYRGLFISFVIFALFGAMVAVMWYGAKLVEQGDMSVGQLISFILYTTFIGGSVAGLGNIYGQLQKAIGASERVLEILEEKGEDIIQSNVEQDINWEIQLDRLRFSYPTRPEISVLNDLSFSLERGSTIALVGPSGAGKSTIVQLLLRYYEPTQGQILVDGKPISTYDLHGYRKGVGIVPQEVMLFGGTIRENILYGNPNASAQELEDAVTQAYASEFIDQFPDKLDTVVGEKGIKLSGGQRQRIAIARAILKDPSLLLLDEATSSLDAESEQYVQRALDNLMKNRTTIIIAHRLATVKKADRIFVLEKGTIVEEGTHEELLTKEKGLYNRLVSMQWLGA